MTEDTSRTPPEAVPGQDAALIGVVRDQLRRYRALTGAAEAGQAGVYLTGRDLARLADLAEEALTLRTFRDAIDAASVAYHSGEEWADRAVTRFDRAVRVALADVQNEHDAAHAGRGGAQGDKEGGEMATEQVVDPCIAVTNGEKGTYYRGCAADHNGGRPWTDRWARVLLRDGVWCERPTCWEVEFSDGTRFGGEMSFALVDRRCLAWVARGE